MIAGPFGWERRWHKLVALAADLGLRADFAQHDEEIVLVFRRDELRVLGVLVPLAGLAGVVRLPNKRPLDRGLHDGDRASARHRAIDIATSEIARLLARALQWKRGLS